MRKQTAVASLLLAKTGISQIRKSPSGRPLSDEFTEEVAKAVFESPEGYFSEVVSLGALDKTKQVALYYDDWLEDAGLSADQFKQSDVVAIFDQSKNAVEAIRNPNFMRAGMAVYQAHIPYLTGKRDRPK